MAVAHGAGAPLSPRGALHPCRSGTKRRAPAPPFTSPKLFGRFYVPQSAASASIKCYGAERSFWGGDRLDCGRSASPSDYSQCPFRPSRRARLGDVGSRRAGRMRSVRGVRLAARPLSPRSPMPHNESWPCKSNPVRLGSSASRANRALVAFGLSAGVLAAGPVRPVYSSEPCGETRLAGAAACPLQPGPGLTPHMAVRR